MEMGRVSRDTEGERKFSQETRGALGWEGQAEKKVQQ